MFHDRDKSVECFLTDQLLQIRVSLQSKFPEGDIYSPRKPKGFSTCVLQEWKKFYPNSEESNKTIGECGAFLSCFDATQAFSKLCLLKLYFILSGKNL